MEIHAAFMESIGGGTKDGIHKKITGITAGGVVIHGAAAGGRRQVPDDVLHAAPMQGLVVHKDDKGGTYQPVHILGTVAAPARQSK
jgi:hypothetical protein